jgi:Flp pilus assembly protein TadD
MVSGVAKMFRKLRDQTSSKKAVVTAFDAALEIAPQDARARRLRGAALTELSRPAEALDAFDAALALEPGSAEGHADRGAVLRTLYRLAEALESYDRAIALNPGLAEAHNGRGGVLTDLRRRAEALEAFDRALALKPELASAHSNRGQALLFLNRHAEALASFDRAIALRPDFAEAHGNRGNVLSDLCRLPEATASFDAAIALRPEEPDFQVNKAIALLRAGRFAEAWPLYERRWRQPGARTADAFAQPEWTGAEDLTGKTLFLHWEQGLGDTLQFCRYLPGLAQRCGRLAVSVQDPMQRLVRSLEPQIEVLGAHEQPAEFDLQARLLSLPRALGFTLDTLPAPTPLAAEPGLVAAWSARLGARTRPRVGLAWSGNPGHASDHNRSIALDRLGGLLAADVDWICLQKEVRDSDLAALGRAPQLRSFAESLSDFAETAALIENLDLTITADTSVAHLAGALGKPVWILLAHRPDWRWLEDRQDSPWYPTARLFRQAQPGDWGTVIEAVIAALSDAL